MKESHSVRRFLAWGDGRTIARFLACPRDDRMGSKWQFPDPCLSIVSKFLRRPETADAGVSVSGAKNSFLKGDRMAVTAAVAAILSCGPIDIPTTSLIYSTSQLLRRKTADTGAGKKCTARMRRPKS